jgi:hypothetical protein
MQSEQIGQLAGALAKAQAEMPPIPKDKTATVKMSSGEYKYSYADLATVLHIVRPILGKHDLSITQTTSLSERGMILRTTLFHKSGEWIAGEYPVPTAGRQQEIGSHLSYARRYSLTALVGVMAEDDDDANAADGKDAKTDKKPTKRGEPPTPVRDDPKKQRANEFVNGLKDELDVCENMTQIDLVLTKNAKLITELKNKHPDIADEFDRWLLVRTEIYERSAAE